MTDWKPMETAPKDRPILVRRNNDVFYEHHVVWWTGDEPYPWASDFTAYPTDRLDEWIDIPGMNLGSKRFERREGMSIIDEIAAERRRQIEDEGWTAAHDDEHTDGSLANAAACYAAASMCGKTITDTYDGSGGRGDAPVWCTHKFKVPALWPESWSGLWWKPKDRRRDLIRAAALIVAEIERLDRARNAEKAA